MEVNELKVQAFDLIAIKEKYLRALDEINKQLEELVKKIQELEVQK